MSWVSLRRTTVPEDIAYCLLGLFGVNIPLLYGEGEENAFLRLQEAILKISDDESIFLWCATETEAIERPFWGLLAKTPAYFSRSPDISAPCTTTMTTSTPATLTGRGLHVEFLMAHAKDDISNSIFSALFLVDRGKQAYGVLLQKLSYSGTHFVRVGADIVLRIDGNQKIDYADLPHRFLQNWNYRIDVRTFRLFAEPKALRFYVRQNPNISLATLNEVVGFWFEEGKSLPLNVKLDGLSSRWHKRVSGGAFTRLKKDYFFEFEADHVPQHSVYIGGNGKAWISEKLGALQISEQVDGHIVRQALLVGLVDTSAHILNTSLVIRKPVYRLHDTSKSKGNLDEFLKDFSEKGNTYDITMTSDYVVSFDLQIRFAKVYYLVKVKKRADGGFTASRSTYA